MSFSLPLGFRVAGVSCGIKQASRKEDLTLIVADGDVTAAGVYTQNLVYAAPVAWDRKLTPSARMRVVVANSGNANACTGERGWQDARTMAQLAAATCQAEAEQALVLSTGIIGEFLPMERVAQGIRAASERLGREEADWLAAARGITTTDRGPKIAQQQRNLPGGTVRLSGMAKGAGMIGPRMATMLAVLLTDARLAPGTAQQCLHEAVAKSFNCISVEGHTSTNDTVLLLASGAAGPELEGPDLAPFQEALDELCVTLAKMIPDDGEGASHLIVIEVSGCFSRESALQIAKTIAGSALVKTAIAGGDPNWGRIVSAAGYAGVPFNPAHVSLRLNGHQVYDRGAPVPFDAEVVSRAIREQRETQVQISFAEGSSSARFWTSDLNHEYIRVNADYHT